MRNGPGILRAAGAPILLMLLALITISGATARAQQDVPGATDPAGIERFTGAWIAKRRALGPVDDHRIPIDRLSRPDLFSLPTVMRNVRGRSRSVTYAHPRGVDSRAVFDRMRSGLPGERLFTCSSRGCGASTYFANRVFGIAELYGRDAEQHYLVLERVTADGPSLLMLYVSQRGTREVFAHVEEILLETSASDPALARTLADALVGPGVARLPTHPFADDGSLAGDAEPLLAAMSQALAGLSGTGTVWVVVHMQGPIEAALEGSLRRAERLRDHLADGADMPTLRAFGVGGLAPAVLGEARVRVELVAE